MIGNISVRHVDEALITALRMLREHGVPHTAASVANQRETIEWPGVFITEYLSPMRNVLFNPVRDANPFFHYLESMWILAGRNDVRFLAHVLPGMKNYSDNEYTFHGAYGHRMRCWNYTGYDQITEALSLLREKPSSRQVVISIWDPDRDLGTLSKDLPCNDMLMFKVRDGALHITVNNRSNDAIWGAYGANAVQFSMLLGYMAAKLNLKVGTYTQVSNSMHVYTDTPYWNAAHDEPFETYNPDKEQPNLFDDNINAVDADLAKFFHLFDRGELVYDARYESNAVADAALMMRALNIYRTGDPVTASMVASGITAPDWRFVCEDWFDRRGLK